MRRKMREVFDELWIIDLEGDNLGARRTENVFAIRTPVAIAIGVRDGPPRPASPATVWKSRLTGTERAKLTALDSVTSFDKLEWEECTQDWDSPFYSETSGAYSDWPEVTDVFPWQHSGSQLKRTWPIGETREVLAERWQRLLATPVSDVGRVFRETGDRRVGNRYPSLYDPTVQEPSILSLLGKPSTPGITRYAYRSFDRQWIVADSRVGDRIRPELWRTYGPYQVYFTSLLTSVLGVGPAAVATATVPDLHHFNGRGAKDVIPFWRDAQATVPNVTSGILAKLAATYATDVGAQRLFAYAYGILAQPAFVERFWEELEMPPPHLPVTKSVGLFQRVADHGERLLYLHTYGERFGSPDDDGSVLQGSARCTKAVSQEDYPGSYEKARG